MVVPRGGGEGWDSGPQTKENERLRFEPNTSIRLIYPAPDFRVRVVIAYKGLFKIHAFFIRTSKFWPSLVLKFLHDLSLDCS